MKVYIKRLFALLTAVLLLTVTVVPAMAEGGVTYDGNAKKFVFEPGSEYSPTDLFTDFKNMMPGDSITQKIFIKNDVSNDVKIKLYIRSAGASEGSEDFLSKLKLTVSQDGSSKLFDAPANETAQLTDWVYLGTFYSGAEIDLNVTVSVPAELSNEYQDAVGHLEWQFKAEELPVEPDDPKPPQTGDRTSLPLYITTASLSGRVLVFLIVLVSRRKLTEN
ncbi:MAG: hypothetical protein IKZ03_05735 [Clostridia bacterium]|nr:hypothetical protein [Clostridia bacterium]